MGKPTPGPWFYAHRETPLRKGFYTEVFTNDGGSGHGTIATLNWYPMPADERGAIGTYREANARLMAAAPDLLKELMCMVECARIAGITIGNMDAARAAIARALPNPDTEGQQA